jgi:hypothetical protein
MYFTSNRPLPDDARRTDPQAWPATVRENVFRRTYDIYEASMTDGGAGPATVVAELLSPYNEGAPCVSPSGDFVYFSSDRPGGEGGFDLYRARRVQDELNAATNLGPPVNTPANELDPALAQLGYALYFSSDRGAAELERHRSNRNVGSPSPTDRAPSDSEVRRNTKSSPNYNLYYSSSREVFRGVDRYTRPVDLAALMPWLLWLLLALLLLLLLRALLGAVRDKRLGLLTRCLLASMMAHLLLLLLLSFWKVSQAAFDAMNRPGEIRVALAPRDPSDSLAGQLREVASAIELPAPEALELEREAPAIVVKNKPTEATLATARPTLTPAQLAAPRATDDTPIGQRRRPIDPPVAQRASKPLLDVAVPEETARIDAREDRTEVAVAAPASPLTRDRIKVATSQPARLPREIAPSPATAVAPESLGGALKLHEAAPQASAPESPRVVRLPKPEHSPDSVVSLQVGLPGESAEPVAVRAEHAVHVEVETTPIVPMPDITPIGDAPRAASIASIEPVSSASEFVLASAVKIVATEGSTPEPSRANRADRASRRSPGPRIALGELTLPTLEEAIAAASDEIGAPTAAAGEAELKLAKARLTPLDSGYSAAVELKPTATAEHAKIEAAAPFSPSKVSDAQPLAKGNVGRVTGLAPAKGRAHALDLQIPIETLDHRTAAESPSDAIRAARHWAAGEDGFQGSKLIGVIHGRVANGESDEPLTDALVRLDMPGSRAIIVRTDAQGQYALPIPEMPDNFALTASRDGFVPGSANIPLARMRGGLFEQDFVLQPTSETVIPVESSPVVHHLGNDRWEGTINSQFQRNAEGRTYLVTFTVTAEQIAMGASEAAVQLLAKGVQCPHRVRINGQTVQRRLSESPNDGSFGEARIPFDADWLIVGQNVLEIRAGSCLGDIDDFEFVNVTVQLR